MSSKLSSSLLASGSAAYAYKPTFLSLRVLQELSPPPNPARAPLPFLLPRLYSRQHTTRSTPTRRSFSASPHPCKKAGREKQEKQTTGKGGNKRPPQGLPGSKEDVDPHDMTAYKEEVNKTKDALKAELARVKAGGAGRDPEAIEGIRVKLDGEKGVKLGEVAQVVPRGKVVAVLIGEKTHVKPITSALAQPPHNLNAQSSPTDPLTLTIPLPPVTQESRLAAAKVATEKGEAAQFALREARGAQRKKLRALELGRLVGPDELRRAEKELDKANEGAVAEVKKLVEEGRKKVMGQ